MSDDEQAFWDRAFIELLGSYTRLEWRQIEGMKIDAKAKGVSLKEYMVECCTVLADAALAARQRKEST